MSNTNRLATPGPWKVIEHNSGASRVQAGRFDILLTSTVGATADVWTANARLIAAAPELLAACVQAEGYASLNTVSTPPVSVTFAVLDALRTAIAKAIATNAVDPVARVGQEDATRDASVSSSETRDRVAAKGTV